MIFQQLVELKKAVRAIQTNLLPDESLTGISPIVSLLNNFDILDINQTHDSLSALYTDMLNKNRAIRQTLETVILKIDQSMIDHGLQLSNDPGYSSKFVEDQLIGSRSTLNFTTNEEIEQIIKTRVNTYTDWRYPALYLHSISEINRIDYMVDADPLYIAGGHPDQITDQIKKYPALYQNRLRQYHINKEDFGVLPHAQFGFIFCWEYFNLLSVCRVEQYLTNILRLLRPGGTVMFSYTDAEIDDSARLVDNGHCAWASKSYINALLIKLGFQDLIFTEIKNKDTGMHISWVEATKSGQLTSAKKGQVLGTVRIK